MKLAGKLVLLLAVAALAGGCGAAGKDTDASRQSPGKNTGAQNRSAEEDYNVGEEEVAGSEATRSGFMTCQLYPLEELARQNNVKATPEAVAAAVSSLEATEQDRKDVYDGCIKGIKSFGDQ
jgi:hypothetical protein